MLFRSNLSTYASNGRTYADAISYPLASISGSVLTVTGSGAGIAAGDEVLELSPDARAAFKQAVKPLHDEARRRFGDDVFGLIPRA